MEALSKASLRRRAAATLVAALLLTAHSAGYVSADHGGVPFGSTGCGTPGPPVPVNCVSVANTVNHYIYVSPLITGSLKTALLATISEDYQPTDLIMATQTTINLVTDVEAYAADYGNNGVAGWVVCPPDAPQGINAKNDRWCRNQGMRFNLDAVFAAYFADTASRNHITCHELGHTVGLQHAGATGCMTANTPNGSQNLSSTDKGHINGYY